MVAARRGTVVPGSGISTRIRLVGDDTAGSRRGRTSRTVMCPRRRAEPRDFSAYRDPVVTNDTPACASWPVRPRLTLLGSGAACRCACQHHNNSNPLHESWHSASAFCAPLAPLVIPTKAWPSRKKRWANQSETNRPNHASTEYRKYSGR